jgi:hypothetical protein
MEKRRPISSGSALDGKWFWAMLGFGLGLVAYALKFAAQ